MKNNKGFAITATIYGFLILFLIILLSVLSVMRSQNNRSITISEKIENKLFPSNEIEIDSPETVTTYEINKRGKYYIRLLNTSGDEVAACDGTGVNKCFIYLPNTGTLKIESQKLKIEKSGTTNNMVIYNENGNTVTNNNIGSFVITKYYSSNDIIVDYDLNYIDNNMKNWEYMYKPRFKVEYYQNDFNNSIYVYGDSNWEQIYYPIPVENGKKYTITFDCFVNNNYNVLSTTYGGVGYQVLKQVPEDRNNIDNNRAIVTQYLPTEKSNEKQKKSIQFTANTSTTYYLNFNFGMAADYQDVLINISNIKITNSTLKSVPVSIDQEYGTLPTVTRSGKTFKEWNTKRDGTGKKITSNTKVEISQNHTLYAIWQ